MFSEKYFSTDKMYRQAKTLKITPSPYFCLDLNVYFTYYVLCFRKMSIIENYISQLDAIRKKILKAVIYIYIIFNSIH